MVEVDHTGYIERHPSSSLPIGDLRLVNSGEDKERVAQHHTLVSFAISAAFVGLDFDQGFQSLLVLTRSVWWLILGSPGHVDSS